MSMIPSRVGQEKSNLRCALRCQYFDGACVFFEFPSAILKRDLMKLLHLGFAHREVSNYCYFSGDSEFRP